MIQIATSEKALIEVLIASVVVDVALNRLATAQVFILDGSLLEQPFAASNDARLAVGAEVQLLLEGEGERPIFSGIVVRHSLQMNANIGTLLCLELKHKAVKMSHARRSHVFQTNSEADIFQQLGKRSGIKLNNITIDGTPSEKYVQYNVSDWDYMVMRAEANGLVIAPNGDALNIFAPKLDSAVATFQFGETIVDFNVEIDARQQFTHTEAHSWNFEDQVKQTSSTSEVLGINEDAATINRTILAKAMSDDAQVLIHSGDHNTGELEAWAKARLLRSALTRMRGSIEVLGTNEVTAGSTITIAGASDNFNGDCFVSAVRQEFSDNGWQTYLEIGLDEALYASVFDVNDVPVAGLLTKMPGIQIGIVTEVEDDPRKQHRIKVSFLGIPEAQEGIWARLASPIAGAKHGIFFRPQVGDEVLLGFLNEDPRDVIVLGALYNSDAHSPAFKTDDHYAQQGIVTAAGLRLQFDESSEEILLETPAGDKIRMVGKQGSKGITVQDQFGNKIEMGQSGIVLKSAGDLVMEAQGEITMKGLAIKAEASTELILKGNATAELKSAGILNIKGALVNIN